MRAREYFNESEVYICKMQFPICDKSFRVVGLGGEVQDAFYKLFNTDMLLLKDDKEVEDALMRVKEYLGR